MLSKISLIAATAAAYDYASNGGDWADLEVDDNNCAGSNQSPINLISKASKDFKSTYKKKILKFKDDEFLKEYSGAAAANPVFNGHTVQTDLDVTDDGPINTFTSMIASEIFGADTEFDAQQFHFHAGSEHTIDDVRHDFEMHTVHYPKETEGEFIAAAMGIMFSVENYTAELSWLEERVIDDFFNSLDLADVTEAGPTVTWATYGTLMEMVDMSNRWVYKGSVTTPPCAANVYWNVLSTIYPIKAETLALFVTQLDRGEEGELGNRGNWREIQEIDG